jgi:hypothetical protein
MEKYRPGSDPSIRLTVSGWYAAYRAGQPSWSEVRYAIETDQGRQRLDGVQWADWDRSGRLLVATTTARLEVREAPFDATTVSWSIDLSEDRPEPIEPPAIARRWVE